MQDISKFSHIVNDLSLKFKPNLQKDIAYYKNERAINESLKNIFLCEEDNKLFEPMFGLNMKQFLFEPLSVAISTVIKMHIETYLPKYEKRIELHTNKDLGITESVTVNVDYKNKGYVINIYYLILEAEISSKFQTFLEKIR